MAASSVTGVGQGSAISQGGTKGSAETYLGIEKLIGTRIVLSGSTTLSSGSATVTFPDTLPGVDADYIVLTGGGSSYSYASSVATTGFSLTGTGSQTISWVVVRVTNSTVDSYPTQW